jgi:hypothetical protein
MIEDRELENWRGQWDAVATSSANLEQKVVRRIRRQEIQFVVGNLLTGIVFLGMLIFGVFLREQAKSIGSGWAAGIAVLVVVMVSLRVWFQRGTWRAETQSTRAFLEVWRRRVEARLRLLRASVYVSVGWLVFCAVLTFVNWETIGVDVKAKPREWGELLIACLVMQPVLWGWARWLRRRKLAELDEVKKMLEGM